jgi:hypothetical protein
MNKKQVKFLTVFTISTFLIVVPSYYFFQISSNAQSLLPQDASNSTFFNTAFWQTVLSGLVVFVITAPVTWFLSKRFFKKTISAAPKQYARELDLLIEQAHKEGVSKAVVNARAIVAARNSLKESLTTISRSLNSEIDRLANEMSETRSDNRDRFEIEIPIDSTNSSEEIYNTIEVLHRIWPAKKSQIEVQVRQILAELGLDIGSVE